MSYMNGCINHLVYYTVCVRLPISCYVPPVCRSLVGGHDCVMIELLRLVLRVAVRFDRSPKDNLADVAGALCSVWGYQHQIGSPIPTNKKPVAVTGSIH